VEKSPVGIRIIRDNVIKYAYPMSAKIFGYSPGEIIDKDPLELVIEEDRPNVSQHLGKSMKPTSLSPRKCKKVLLWIFIYRSVNLNKSLIIVDKNHFSYYYININ